MGRLFDYSIEKQRILTSRPAKLSSQNLDQVNVPADIVIFPGVRYERICHGNNVKLADLPSEKQAK